jgi:hypothetical protein
MIEEFSRGRTISEIEELLQGHCAHDYKYSEPICGYESIKNALVLIKELTKENERLRKQLEPFKVKRCFTCSFYGVGDDHMPCYVCRDYDKYKWLGDDIHIGDRVQTLKGRGVVSVIDNDIITVDLDGDHGGYCFFKDSVWKIDEVEV